MNRPEEIAARTWMAKPFAATLFLVGLVFWGPSSRAFAQTSAGRAPDFDTAALPVERTLPNDDALEIPGAVEPDLTEPDIEVGDLTGYARQAQEADSHVDLYSGAYVAADGVSFETPQMRRLGITVEDDLIELDGHLWVQGVAVEHVAAGSPVAVAGLKSQRKIVQHVLDGMVLAASVLFPPASFGIPLLHQERVGESCDLIVGVDAEQIHNVMDFEDRIESVTPGEAVYFNVIRGGRRRQIAVYLPRPSAAQQP